MRHGHFLPPSLLSSQFAALEEPGPDERPIIKRALISRLRKQQSNFAGEPRRAPIKTHLTPELTSNYVFYNAGAAPAMRGGAMVGPPDSVQRKLSCPPIVRDHTISTSPSAADSDPYFAALVASSCNEIAIA